jgi:hypothetical protein
MLITKEWLDKTILLNEQGSYQLSPKQMELLHTWFPELFKDGPGIDFIKHWNREILGKEINDIKAKLFADAKTEEGQNYKIVSEHLKERIKTGIDFCIYAKGTAPKHPHLKLVSLIGHIPEVNVTNVQFTPEPDELTIVDFDYEDNENFKYLRCVCGGSPIETKDGKKVLETKLYSMEPVSNPDVGIIPKEIKDCTGRDIIECINELRKKKKFIIKRKPVVLEAASKDEGYKTTKQKDKEHKQAAKWAKKNGLPPIQPRSNFERLYDMFMDDFMKVNKKRSKKNLPDLTLAEFAAIMGVDMQSMSSLQKYKPGHIDWEKTLK